MKNDKMININPNEVIERGIIANISNSKDQIQQIGVDLTIKYDIVINTGCFMNIELNESFDMQDTFGLIIVRSSFSRKGIFMSSGVFDPGFKGVGGVSLYNMSGAPIEIKKGTRIGQMVVYKADAASMYNGHYNHTESVESKL